MVFTHSAAITSPLRTATCPGRWNLLRPYSQKASTGLFVAGPVANRAEQAHTGTSPPGDASAVAAILTLQNYGAALFYILDNLLVAQYAQNSPDLRRRQPGGPGVSVAVENSPP